MPAPMVGFSEVSGRRPWGWARDAFGTPEAFFERCFVGNYCPLVWMEDTGRNRVVVADEDSDRNAMESRL